LGGRGQRKGGNRASEGLRSNQIPAARLPILASHHSPANFRRGVSGWTRLDRVNACSNNPKI
jgi:hypothetical protein